MKMGVEKHRESESNQETQKLKVNRQNCLFGLYFIGITFLNEMGEYEISLAKGAQLSTFDTHKTCSSRSCVTQKQRVVDIIAECRQFKMYIQSVCDVASKKSYSSRFAFNKLYRQQF